MTTRLFELLPFIVRDGDPDKAIEYFCDAVQEQYNRARQEIGGIAVLLDADGVNQNYIYQKTPYFDSYASIYPEQFVEGSIGTESVDGDKVTFSNITLLGPEDSFVGYGLRVANHCNQVFYGKYAKIVDFYVSYSPYEAYAIVDPPFGGECGNTMFELCYPDRVYLDPEHFTEGLLGYNNAYKNMYIRVPYGTGSSPLQTRKILKYEGGYNPDAVLTDTLPSQYGVPNNQIVLPFSANNTTNDFYRRFKIVINSGFSTGEERIITDYVAESRTAYIDQDWEDHPQDGGSISLYTPRSIVYVSKLWDTPPAGLSDIEKEGTVLDGGESVVGIVPNFVSLSYLANEIGFNLLETDPESLQRQQILNAVNTYKLKGTEQSFKLLFRTFGLDVSVVELGSNYAHAPEDIPGVPDPTHIQYTTRSYPGSPVYETGMVENKTIKNEGFTSQTWYNTWNDTKVTAGSSSLGWEAGWGRLFCDDIGGGAAEASAILNLQSNRQVTVEFRMKYEQPASFDPNNWYAMCSWHSGDATKNILFFGPKGDSGELTFWIEKPDHTLVATYSTGVNIESEFNSPKDYRLSVIYHDQGSDGHVVLYRKETTTTTWNLVYENHNVDTVQFKEGVINQFYLSSYNNSVFPDVDSFEMLVKNFICNQTTDRLVDDGSGEDGVWALTTGNPTLIIPDSDIALYMKRIHPEVPFGSEIITTILKRIEDIRPIHVEILFIGLLETFEDSAMVTDQFLIGQFLYPTDTVGVSDVFTIIDALLKIKWDVTSHKWDTDTAKWDVE